MFVVNNTKRLSDLNNKHDKLPAGESLEKAIELPVHKPGGLSKLHSPTMNNRIWDICDFQRRGNEWNKSY